MISHTAVTIAWMAVAILLTLVLDDYHATLVVTCFASAVSALWYSREEAQEERDRGTSANLDTLLPWRWKKHNGDFVVPVGVAWLMVAVWMLFGLIPVAIVTAGVALVALPILYLRRGDDRRFN